MNKATVWVIDSNKGCMGIYDSEAKANDMLERLYANGFFGEAEVMEWEVD